MIRFQIAALNAAIRNDKGVTAAEYAILATGIIVAVSAAMAVFAPGLRAVFTALVTKLTPA